MAKKSILIADDEPALRNILKKALKNKGYRFFEASNGKEAVEVVRKNPIDVAILDIMMPEMDGVEALKRIKEIDETIEVLMLTGHTDIDLLKEILFDFGAFDYLLKPFDFDELTFLVRKCFNNREEYKKRNLLKKELEDQIRQLKRDFRVKTFEVRKSQIKYRNIVENSTDPIVVSQDKYLKFANSKALELTGYSSEEILDIPFSEMLHPDDRAEVSERFINRLKGVDVPPLSTFRIMRKDGSFFWAENHAAKSVWGDHPAVLNMIRDISKRKEAEAQLRLQTRRLNERIKALSCLSGISELVEKPGVSEAEICQETVNLVAQAMQYPEVACARIIIHDQEFKTENFRETPWKFAEYIKLNRKHVGVLEVCYVEETPGLEMAPFHGEERKLIKMVVERIGMISQRLRLINTMRIKDAALNSSISGIAFSDLEGNMAYANNSFCQMWGYGNGDEIVGKPFWEFFNKGAGVSRIHMILQEGGSYVREASAVRKDGSSFDVLVSAGVVLNESGKPIRMMSSFIDITQQKKAEESMMRAEKLSSLSHLSAGLAHELRNPLAVISSCTQFCLENVKLERLVRENFEVIYRNNQRANKLIGELLAFAKPDHLEQKEMDINEVLLDVLHMAKLEIDPADVNFVRYLRKGLPKIMGDKGKLGQVFLNIIQNAIQAISGKGKIILKSQFLAADDVLEVSVSDNGHGIPEDYRKKIFDPFFSTKDGGTGLGLSICNSIVEQHRGSIDISGGEDKGTHISVRLPAIQEMTEGT
jgi:PAS domain S-box-containing protein